MTTMPVEIFSDNIDDNEEPAECNKSLSKMNKSELYQLCKKLVNENHKLQLFVNTSDELHKQNQNIKLDMSKKIEKLEKDIEELKNLRVVRQTKEKIQKLQNENDKLNEDKDNLEDKIVEQDVEISNLKLDLEEAKSYEKSFNKVKANKDDIEEDLSEEINNLQKEIRELKEKHCTVCLDYDKLAEDHEELKEKDKKAKEIFKLMGEWYEDNIIGHLPESEEEDE